MNFYLRLLWPGKFSKTTARLLWALFSRNWRSTPNKRKGLLIFALLHIWICSRASAFNFPQVVNYEKSDYQANSQNWSVAQGSNGYMYIGNSAGLLEFDGQRWATYPLPEKQIVRAVACNAQGKIFTGGYGEFGYWQTDGKSGLIYRSLSSRIESDRTSREEIWHILALDSFSLFQSFGTMYKYDYRKDIAEEVRPPSNILFSEVINGTILIPTISGEIYSWSDSLSFVQLSGLEIVKGKRVSFLLPFQDGVLIGTKLNGLYFYKNGECSVYKNSLNQTFKNVEINDGLLLSDGRIAIGTILNGVYLLDQNGRLLYHVNKEKGLQNNTTLHLYEDRQNNLWVGLDRGVDLLALNENLVYFRDNTGQLGTVYTAAIFEEYLYIGTNQGVFYRALHAAGDRFQLLEGSQGQVWELKIFDNQLICGHNRGAFAIRSFQFTPISAVTGGWSTCRLSANKFLQGTYTGLITLQKNARDRWQFDRRVGGFTGPIKKIIREDSHTFWALNPYRGLNRLRLDSNWTEVVDDRAFSKKDGLPSEFNLRLYLINDEIVIKSDKRFFVWKENRLQACHKLYNIPIAAPNGLIEANNQDWFQIKDGQIEWRYKNKLVQKFSTNLELEDIRILYLDSLSYLLCLKDNYILLHRKDTFTRRPFPPPQIKTVEQFKRLRKRVVSSQVSKPEIQPTWNNVRFIFAAPVFTQKALFRYRLPPVYPEWSEWSVDEKKEFVNLSPGDYEFELMSNLSETSAHLSFSVLPKWYQTVWAKLLFLVSLLGFLYGVWRWHQHRMKRQGRRLRLEKERELHRQRIQAKNERLQLEIQNKSRELANSTFNLVQKNEMLSQIKGRLLKLKNAPDAKFPARQYQNLIRLIDDQLNYRRDKEFFDASFDEIHEAFFKKLKKQYPALTPGDLRLAAYLRMNLSSKEIASMLFITPRGVENKRYRLRKKLQLKKEENLAEFLITF